MVDTRTCDASGDGDMESADAYRDVESYYPDMDTHVDVDMDAYVDLVAAHMEATTAHLSTAQGDC